MIGHVRAASSRDCICNASARQQGPGLDVAEEMQGPLSGLEDEKEDGAEEQKMTKEEERRPGGARGGEVGNNTWGAYCQWIGPVDEERDKGDHGPLWSRLMSRGSQAVHGEKWCYVVVLL